MGKTPEHDKLLALEGANQTVGEFLDWLDEQGLTVCTLQTHITEVCSVCGGDGLATTVYEDEPCGRCGGSGEVTDELVMPRYMPSGRTPQALIGGFFGIDPAALEAEKQAMLDELRAVAMDRSR